jgi:hypothetical protein
MKITEFTATATILGQDRQVSVRQDYNASSTSKDGEDPPPVYGFTITPCDADLAQKLIGILAGSVGVVEPIKETPAVAATKPKTTKAKPEPESQVEATGGTAQPAAEAPKTEAKKTKKLDQPVMSIAVELPDNIRNTGTMRELLTYLVDKGGVPTVELLVTTCEALKDSVPILGKVPDVRGRIVKAAEVLNLFKPLVLEGEVGV